MNSRLRASGITNSDLDRIRLIAQQRGGVARVKKGYTQPTPADGTGGLRFYDLRGPASRFNPVYSIFRNEIPRRDSPRGTTGIHWKAITGVNTGNILPGVSEGNRNAPIAQSMEEYFQGFAGIGMENFTTFESEYATRGYADVNALANLDALESLINGEERLIVGGNQTLAFGVAPTPSGSIVATGGALTAQSWRAYVVALTYEGKLLSSVANGVATEFTRTNADSSVDNIQGGSSNKSAESAAVVSAGANSILWVWNSVPGAAGYAIYVGLTGAANCKLIAITDINEYLQVADPNPASQAASVITGDHSKNPLAFDGKLIQIAKPGSGAVISSLDGEPITVNAAGTIDEFDDIFRQMWDKGKVGPTRAVVSPMTRVAISKAVFAAVGANNTPFISISVQMGNGGVKTGIQVESILNPYTGEFVPFVNHPYFPEGTVLFETLRLPYSLNGMDSRPWVIETRQEYYQITWPRRSRKTEFGVYCDEGLIGNIPYAHALVQNIGK